MLNTRLWIYIINSIFYLSIIEEKWQKIWHSNKHPNPSLITHTSFLGLECRVWQEWNAFLSTKKNDNSECLLTAYYSTTGVNEGFSSELTARLICYGFAWDYLQDAAPVELYSVCTCRAWHSGLPGTVSV